MSTAKGINILQIGSDYTYSSQIIGSQCFQTSDHSLIGVVAKINSAKIYRYNSVEGLSELMTLKSNSEQMIQFLDITFNPRIEELEDDQLSIGIACSDGYIRLWSKKIQDQNRKQIYLKHLVDKSRVNKLGITSSGTKMISVTNSGKVVMTDLIKLSNTLIMDSHQDSLSSMVIHNNEYLVAVGEQSGYIVLWDCRSGRYICDFNNFNTGTNYNILNDKNIRNRHSDRVNSLNFSSDGGLLCSSSDDSNTFIWDLRKQTLIKKLFTGTDRCIYSKFAKSSYEVQTVSSNSEINLCNWYTGEITNTCQIKKSNATTFGFFDQSNRCLLGYKDRVVDFFSLNN